MPPTVADGLVRLGIAGALLYAWWSGALAVLIDELAVALRMSGAKRLGGTIPKGVG